MPRSLNRTINRSLHRGLNRPLDRTLSGCSRPPPVNYIARVILACRKAIQARRNLMRLAPRVFDMAVVDRERQAEEERAASEAEFQRAIAKVYQVPEAEVIAKWPRQPASPWPKCPRTLRAIEREVQARDLWLQIAGEAMRDFRKFQPHRPISLSDLCRLITVSSRLGRLATGLETLAPNPPPPDPSHVSFQQALEKVYGRPEMTTPVPATGAETV